MDPNGRNIDPQRVGHARAGKRFRLTLLFTDLTGSTQLANMLEAERYSELLSRLNRVWHEVVAAHGGRILQTRGDGALAVFGYPRSGEDDGRRAGEAALDIHERVRTLSTAGLAPGFTLTMHSGIHAGTVLVAEGDAERGLFEVTGVVANEAAHLSDAAAPGQILASFDSLGPHANYFELGDDPRAASASAGRIRACAILKRGNVTRRFEAIAKRGLTPFIGRSEVMGRLRQFVAGQDDAPRCLVIVGAPGLGKTRLLEELVARREVGGVTLLRGGCESYLGAEVLQPFLQMLRACISATAELPQAEPARSAGTPAAPAALAAAAEAMLARTSFEALKAGLQAGASGMVGDLLAFFEGACATRQVLLIIDDWQSADDASRQLLEALLQLPSGPRALLAARPRDDGAEWIAQAPHLHLRPFQTAETGTAVKRWLPDADPFLVAKIHGYAGGVPLFVEELCHSGATVQQLDEVRAKQGWLATLVGSRLDRLPQQQAEVVRAAAVIGTVIPLWLLTWTCGYQPSGVTLQALADADFLYGDEEHDALRFKHGVTRDAVYEKIGLSERTDLHERIEHALLTSAEAAEREDWLEALAYHCRHADHYEAAAQYGGLAGDKASAAFALDRARTQYQGAMAALDKIERPSPEQLLEWCKLANKLGFTCIFDPLSLNDDLTVFEKAVARARDLGRTDVLAYALYWLGYMCYGFGHFRESVEHLRAGLALAQQMGNESLGAQIEAALGQSLAASCSYQEAIVLMDRAVVTKKQRSRASSGIAIGSAYTLACKGSVLADQGDFGSAHACFDEAMVLLHGSTHPVANSVRNWVAVALIWQGRWREAEAVAVESARIAENTRGLLLLAVCRAAAGFARWAGNADAGGLAQLRDAVQWIQARRGRFYTSLYYGWLAEAFVEDGRYSDARACAARVLLRARQGERLGEAVACRAIAIAAARARESGAAERWLARAEASARIRASAREAALNTLARARVLELQGAIATSERLRAEAAAELETLGMPWHRERALVVTRGG